VIAKERGRSCWAADSLIASRGGSIRLHAASGGAAALIELIDLERECCAWIQSSVTRDPSAGVADVVLTADGEGEAVLAGMFVAG